MTDSSIRIPPKKPPFQRGDANNWEMGLKTCLAWLLQNGLVVMATLLVGGLLYALFFYRLGSYPLFDVDEPRYAEAAREMLVSGNWITPTFNDALRFDKPVFFYWLIAISYQLFGISEFSARLVSALSATAIIGMVFTFCRYLLNTRTAVFASMILASSLIFIGLSRMSITDMNLCTWMCGTFLSLFLALHRNARWWLVAGLFAGVSILTKGPVGLVLPGTVALVYAFLTGRLKRGFLTPWFPLALIVSVAVAAPWYVLAYQQNGQVFLDALFFHNVTRFSGTVSGHDQPVWFFVPVLLVGFLPWSAYLPAAAVYTLKPGLKRLMQRLRLLKERGDEQNTATGLVNAVGWYALVWVTLVFVFFTAAQTKLLTYILPLFPGLAILMALFWETACQKPKSTLVRAFTQSTWVLGSLFLVVGAVFSGSMHWFLPREASEIAGNYWNILAISVLVSGTLLSALFMGLNRVMTGFYTLTATMGLLALVAVTGVIPNINQATQGTMMTYLDLSNDTPLATYEIVRPSLTFYARHRIPHVAKDDYVTLVKLLRLSQNSPSLSQADAPMVVNLITKNRFLPQLQALLSDHAVLAGVQLSVLQKDAVYCLVQLSRLSSPVNPSRTPVDAP